MKNISLITVILIAAVSALHADSLGWRGDGSGQVPDAKPPLKWGRISAQVKGLRFQAEKPKGNGPSGKAMPDGVIREWLVLGPLPMAPDKGTADPLGLGAQIELQPGKGTKTGDRTWALYKAPDSTVDFRKAFPQTPDHSQAAYAHVYVYSATGGKFIGNINHMGGAHVWLNGKMDHKPDDKELNYQPRQWTLVKGWNRILIRLQAVPKGGNPVAGTWYASVTFYGAPGAQYTTDTIKWTVEVPSGQGFGGPILVGDKLFLQSGYADLICFDKKTGRILWLASNNYDDFATAEERKAQPAIFKELAPLSAKLKQVNASFRGGKGPKLENVSGSYGNKEKGELEGKIYKLMRKVDAKKYMLPKGQDVGFAGMNPVSDGKHVWAWYATGVTACYDLKGKLIWRNLDNRGSFFEHGYSVSAYLYEGKLLTFMNQIICRDAKNGKILWEQKFKERSANRIHGNFAGARIGREPVIVVSNGAILRLSDGAILFEDRRMASQQEIPTPVVAGKDYYKMTVYSSQLFKVGLPKSLSVPLSGVKVRELKIDTTTFPSYYNYWHLCSPIIDKGLAYVINNCGVLTVVDVKTMKIVYQRYLDLDQFMNHHSGAARGLGISPVLAGKHLFIFGATGACLVLEPGRTYKEVAKNKIENSLYRRWTNRHERFVGNPIFDQDKIYIRGERNLYCIGK
ncbi:PQQ-binding-like beta-propeller repeat protein [Planctomycetota bacterium]